MRPFNSFFYIVTLLLFSAANRAYAQTEMADLMRQEGKIYVVVAVIIIIFVTLAAYLIYLDRKVSKIEKESQVK